VGGEALGALVLFLAVLAALAYPLGLYLARVASSASFGGVAGAVERAVYRAASVDPAEEMPWARYAVALMLFNTLGVIIVYVVQRLQSVAAVESAAHAECLAGLGLQYRGEFRHQYQLAGLCRRIDDELFHAMAGALAVQNFFSAATGIAVAFALIRGFARHSAQGIGNFWVDLTRSILYVLLPLSLLLAVVFMGQGVIQNFSMPTRTRSTLESVTYTQPKLDAAGSRSRMRRAMR
jgi:K+-transporting ATPase ATPase A chain